MSPSENASANASASALAAPWVMTNPGHREIDKFHVGAVGNLAPNGTFEIDAVYHALSSVFQTAHGMYLILPQSPKEGTHLQTADMQPVAKTHQAVQLAMPPEAVDALRTNLIVWCAPMWARPAEIRAVLDHAAMDLPLWDVSLTYTARLFEEDQTLRADTYEGLLESPQTTGLFSAYAPAGHRGLPATRLSVDTASYPPLNRPLPPDVVDHEGPMDLVVEATLRLRAPTMAVAGQVMRAVALLANESESIKQVLNTTPRAILSITGLDPSDRRERHYPAGSGA